ncbi:MAG TPA: hypothetical protein VHW00_15270 [Thermoanaerobaculia bacterium]|nr:hypothetical protein [Thermoanaerobaculia bacterium]
MKLLRKSLVLAAIVMAPVLLAQHGTVTTTGVGTAGVQIESDGAYPDVNVKTGNSTTSGFRIFNSNNATLLNVNAAGDVAIGTSTTSPERLYVFEDADANTLAMVENPNTGVAAAAGFRAQTGSNTLNFQTHGAGRTVSRFGITALGGWAEILNWQGNGLVMGTSQAAPLILGTNNVNRLHITSDGKIGIGTPAPSGSLHVYGTATADTFMGVGPDMLNGPALNIGYGGLTFGRGAGFINVRPDASAVAPNPSFRLMVANTQRLMVSNTGAVGIGSTVPTERLEVTGGSIYLNSEDSGLVVDAAGYKRYGLVKNSGRNTEWRYLQSAPFRVRRLTSGTDVRSGSAPSDVPMVFTAAGNVGIGSENGNDAYKLHVTGNAHFTGSVTADGTLAAKYQDVAEWVPSREDLAPGTVVVLDALRGNAVIASSTAYDTAVAGVVSEQPGLILGQAAADKEQIATTGRVRVKVDATSAPIRIGDLLVTSDKPGYAMKSIPVQLSGIAMHRPGTIVGKALEPIESGEGEILVLLSLQ